jgi:hypothetical protein
VHAFSPKAYDEQLTRVLSEDADANPVRNPTLCAQQLSEPMRNTVDEAKKIVCVRSSQRLETVLSSKRPGVIGS